MSRRKANYISKDLEESTLIQQLTTRQAERFRIQPERAAFTWSMGGTLIFVELAALEGPDLQNSTVAGQNLGVGYFSAPKTGHRRHAYAFIAVLSAELKELCTAEARSLGPMNEAETLACEQEGLVVVGILPTGGNWEGTADVALRLQPTWVGDCVSYLLTAVAPFLGADVYGSCLKAQGQNKGKRGKKGKGAGALPKRVPAPGVAGGAE